MLSYSIAMEYACQRAIAYYKNRYFPQADGAFKPRGGKLPLKLERKLDYFVTAEAGLEETKDNIHIKVLCFAYDGEIVFGETVKTLWSEWWWVRQGKERQKNWLISIMKNAVVRNGIDLRHDFPLTQEDEGIWRLNVRHSSQELRALRGY